MFYAHKYRSKTRRIYEAGTKEQCKKLACHQYPAIQSPKPPRQTHILATHKYLQPTRNKVRDVLRLVQILVVRLDDIRSLDAR